MKKEQLYDLLQEPFINSSDFDNTLIEFFDNLVSVLEVIEAQREIFNSLDLKVPFNRANVKMRQAVTFGLLNHKPKQDNAPVMVKLSTITVANISAMLATSSTASEEEIKAGANEILTQFQKIFSDAINRREAVAPFGQELTEEQQKQLLA